MVAPGALAAGYVAQLGELGCPTTGPNGESIGYYVVNGDGSCNTAKFISQDEFQNMVNTGYSMVQEGSGGTIGTDVPSSVASEGASLWDRLSSAATSLKGAAFDFFTQDIGELTWGAGPEIVPVAAAGYIGWKVGTFFANLLGISSGSGSENGVYTGVQTVTPRYLEACPAGSYITWGGSTCLTTQPTGDTCYYQPASGSECGVGYYQLTQDSWVVVWSNNWIGEPFIEGNNQINNGQSCNGGDEATQEPQGVRPVLTTANHEDSTNSLCETYAFIEPISVTGLPGPGQGSVATPSNSCENSAGCSLTALSPTCTTEACIKQNVANTLTNPDDHQGSNRKVWTHVCSDPAGPCYGKTPTSGTGTITLPAITPNETYDEWVAAARAAGLVGTITKVVLSDQAADPSVAPNDVTATSPEAGSRVDPNTEVQVMVNPATVPATAAGPPGSPPLPGVSLPNVSTPCTVFPFGVPCWIANALASWATASAPWVFDFPIPDPIDGTTQHVHIDLSVIDPALTYIRPVLVCGATLLIAWAFFGMALGGRGAPAAGGGDED